MAQEALVPESRSRAYLRKLRALLSVTSFFEGYDGFVIALVLPLILGDLGGSESQAGVIRTVIGIGAVVGFLLAAQGDRIGRRRLLSSCDASRRPSVPTDGVAIVAKRPGGWVVVGLQKRDGRAPCGCRAKEERGSATRRRRRGASRWASPRRWCSWSRW